MTENGKRSLRERRAPKSFDSDVNNLLNRIKIMIHLGMDVLLTIKYYLPYPGCENSFTTTKF
jgi:hypothetical protein